MSDLKGLPPAVDDQWKAKITFPSEVVETVNGREIRRYRIQQGVRNTSEVIYAVGGVGFYHLDEARLYAKGESGR